MAAFRFTVLASIAVATVATAQTPDPAALQGWQAQRYLTVAGSNFNDALYAALRGGAYDGVAALFIERSDLAPGFGVLCTGALLGGGRDILTAAHCLADENGNVVATSVIAVFFPPGQPPTFRELAVATAPWAFRVHDEYTGEVIDEHDVGMVRLDAAPTDGITRYDLYSGPTIGEIFNVVGSGSTGTGNTGITQGGGFNEANRRQGLNRYDFSFTDPAFGGFWDDFFGTAGVNVLLSDFDNGLVANDASCRVGDLFSPGTFCNLGTGLTEVGLGGGDSGGPGFINGQIASVNSFGLTFGTNFGDINNQLNSSFGEFSGYASVGYNEDWIRTNTVPEPGSMALLATGLAGIAARWKRRKRQG